MLQSPVKIAKTAAEDTPDKCHKKDRIKYQAVVDECQKLLDDKPSNSNESTEERSKRNRSQGEDGKSSKSSKVNVMC